MRYFQKLEQMHWLEEVKQTQEDGEQMTLETIRELIEGASSILHFPQLEEHLGQLHKLLEIREQWEEKAKKLLNSR